MKIIPKTEIGRKEDLIIHEAKLKHSLYRYNTLRCLIMVYYWDDFND